MTTEARNLSNGKEAITETRNLSNGKEVKFIRRYQGVSVWMDNEQIGLFFLLLDMPSELKYFHDTINEYMDKLEEKEKGTIEKQESDTTNYSPFAMSALNTFIKETFLDYISRKLPNRYKEVNPDDIQTDLIVMSLLDEYTEKELFSFIENYNKYLTKYKNTSKFKSNDSLEDDLIYQALVMMVNDQLTQSKKYITESSTGELFENVETYLLNNLETLLELFDQDTKYDLANRIKDVKEVQSLKELTKIVRERPKMGSIPIVTATWGSVPCGGSEINRPCTVDAGLSPFYIE